jgi:ECF sigma factor
MSLRPYRLVIIDFMTEVTRILSAMEEGDLHAAEQLLPLVYGELRKLAAHKLAQERPDHTLQATALVHSSEMMNVLFSQTSAHDYDCPLGPLVLRCSLSALPREEG